MTTRHDEMRATAKRYIAHGSDATNISEASVEVERLSRHILELLDFIDAAQKKELADFNSGKGLPGSDERDLFLAIRKTDVETSEEFVWE